MKWKKKDGRRRRKNIYKNDVGNKKSQARIYRLELIDGLSVNIDGFRKPYIVGSLLL